MIGTDILSFRRLRGVFNKFPSRIIDKILTQSEREQYMALSSEKRCLEYLGGRFCGKEAIFKAVPNAALTWKRVSILSQPSGRPQIVIDGKVVKDVEVSISHEDDYVIATAIQFNKTC